MGGPIIPLYDPSNAGSQQRMIEEFFQGVKKYVDERIEEELAAYDDARVRSSAGGPNGLPRDLSVADLDERFNAHAVNEKGMEAINESRSFVYGLASVWLDLLPSGRDKSLAYTALEEASFHATAAISRQKGNQQT